MFCSKFDMHTHTTASDGALSPRELVLAAHKQGLSGVAICDHDTLSGLAEAGEAVELLNMQLIAGVELSCELAYAKRQIEVHILGYFRSKPGAELLDRLAELERQRLARGQEILRRLAALAMPLPDLAAAYAGGGSLGRGLIGRKLVETGYVADVDEAFRLYLSEGMPAYVPRTKLGVAEAVGLLHRNGALAVLAHPIQMNCDEAISEVVAAGIDGIEVSHPDHTPADEGRYRELAGRHNLAVTGGSDFHSSAVGDEIGSHFATDVELMALWSRYQTN